MPPVFYLKAGFCRLSRSPRELAGLVIVLSLAVGALSAALIVIHTLLFKPLPYPQPEQLIRVWNAAATSGYRNLSGPQFAILNEGATLLTAAAPYASLEQWASRDATGDRVRLRGVLTTAGLFPTLGVAPSLQWVPTLDEATLGALQAVIVSDRLRRKGLLRGTHGERLNVDGTAYTVVAVMPSEFWFPDPQTDYWLPLLSGPGASTAGWEARVIARLSPGATPEAAQAQIASLFSHSSTPVVPVVGGYRRELVDAARPALRNAQQAVGLLLLLSCMNLAWMFAARARRSERTFAIMAALGAAPRGLILARLAEAAVVGAGSLPLAALIAWLAVRYVSIHGTDLPRLSEAGMSGWALLMALVASLTIVCVAASPSMVIAVRSSRRHDLLQRLNPGGRSFRDLPFMVLQAGLVVALAMQGLVLTLSLRAVLNQNVGFAHTNSVVMHFSAKSAGPTPVLSQFESLRGALLANGVEAAVTSSSPLSGRDVLTNASLTGEQKRRGEATMVGLRAVTPNYFGIVGLPLLRGRFFVPEDETGAVVVNDVMAMRLLGSVDAVGRRFHLGNSDLAIVGVVKSIRHRGLFEEPRPEAYVRYRDLPAVSPLTSKTAVLQFFVVAGDQRGTAETIRRIRTARDHAVPDAREEGAWHFRDLVEAASGERPLIVQVVSAIGALALLLMAAGFYGMLAHSIASRQREIAIRMSLGATPARVAIESLRPAAALWVGGCGLGWGFFVVLSRTAEASLLSAGAPAVSMIQVMPLAAGVLLIAVLAASVRPVVTASRTDPVSVLRAA